MVAFPRMAAAVHARAPASAMVWGPNYGGGYPFLGGPFQASQGSADASALDTSGNGILDGADDPYAPYYPGDDVVDWVGMSLYHWGHRYPWGDNNVPEPTKFAAMLGGYYRGAGGDERALPDFHAVYGEQRGKPVGIFETAALYSPARDGAEEIALKSVWWRQVYAQDLPQGFPRLGMINWFEWDKHETETGGRVNWGVTRSPALLAAFREDLPGWLRYAGDVGYCKPSPG